jgi:hypothetical protein
MCNSTCIIPLKIDSEKRLQNIAITLNYLLKNTDSKIIITEADSDRKLFLNILNDKRVKYIFKKCDTKEFHRTKLINEMLIDVDTDITINYDADILLPPEAHKISEHLILNENYDLVYPYGFEHMDQRKLKDEIFSYNIFKNTLNIKDINLEETAPDYCRFGHVQFFKTKSYISGFMENENYKHWCPEDEERGFRFKILGYKVVWFRSLIFHQEHPPSTLKPPDNLKQIYELHNKLINSSKEQLEEYYSKQNYIKEYKTNVRSSNILQNS